MDSLIINSTEDSPEIRFDTTTNIFIISGESRPENAGKFYAPIINWLNDFEGILYWRRHEMKDSSGSISFIFKLEYFNSTSAKCILDVLLVLKKFVDQGYKINVEWHHDKHGEDILDSGKEFAIMVGMNFKFVED
jgi:hypothetical protein